jgi:hypothetical protein
MPAARKAGMGAAFITGAAQKSSPFRQGGSAAPPKNPGQAPAGLLLFYASV